MAFVHVPGRGFIAQRSQSTHAAHSQQDLLRNPQLQVTDIQSVGQLAVIRIILGDIRMQQVELDPTNIQLIDPCKDLAPWQVNRDLEGLIISSIKRISGRESNQSEHYPRAASHLH